MPNMQIPLAGLGPRAAVACAIYCCDKKPYTMPKKTSPPRPELSCQRLAHRKHSCVTHNLRQRTPSGKLTQKNRNSDVLAAPRSHAKIGGKIRVPDTVVQEGKNWNIIDAKFPCDSKKLNAKMPLNKASAPSTSASGKSMMTAKERKHYKKFKVGGKNGTKVNKVECMTPKEAKAKKGKCSCQQVKTN